MIESNDFHNQILSLVEERGFQLEAAQIQAKALLSEITDEIPAYSWNYIASRIAKNTSFATFALETIAANGLEVDEELSDATRKLAMLWESLANLQEGISRETALLNAAVCYEVAGYQANAACIAKRLLENSQDDDPSLINMTSWYIQRSFVKLNDKSYAVQKEPTIDGLSDMPLIEAMINALAGKCFSRALPFFLRGDKTAIKRAFDEFKFAEHMLAGQGLVEESSLFRSLRSLLPIMQSRSTWTILPPFALDNPRWERYLKLLARGVGADIYEGRSISELWPSQITALYEGGLLTSSSNKIFRMPTSAGKTRIAELAIVHTLVSVPRAKCVYVAPYRALVTELQQSFLNLLSDLGYRVSSITGTYESDDFEELMFREADVIVTTPEKLDLLLRAHPEFLENVRLIVLDEGHIVHDRNRGIKVELLLTRLKRKLASARFIIISAVMPQETLEDFAHWLKASPEEDVLTSTWRPSIQRYAKFEWSGQTGVIRYIPEKEIQKLHEFVPGVIRQRTFEYKNPQTGRINRKKFPKSKPQTAAELALKFAELGPVLVFCSEVRLVRAVANALRSRLDLSLLSGEEIPPYFQNTVNTRSAILAEEWLGEEHFVTLSLKSGLAVHYGPLPEIVRNAIETDFRQRNFRVLIATNTLAQGVNLPIRTVIVHSCWRYIEREGEPGEREQISARDYWNIAGRAGRAGQETEGLIIHIIEGDQDRSDFAYYLSKRENVEPVQSALFRRLVDLIQSRLSEEALKAELDPEILALLVEEGTDTSWEDIAQGIIGDSLAYAQAIRKGFSTERLNQVIVSTASGITARVTDAKHRAVYSSTGLSTNSCDSIRTHIIKNESKVRDFLLYGKIENLTEIIDLLLPILLFLPEMQSQREFAGNVGELLKRWVEGTGIRDLMPEFEAQATSLEDLGRFIDDLFRYRLPWGISGYIRIAAKLLDVDHDDFSGFTRFFPSMIKFGLPDPIACWVMSAGIPLRRTAIEIAAAYRTEAKKPTYQNFLEWLSNLSSEKLHHEFGLESPILEDVSRAIFISSVNPLFQQFTTVSEFLPCEVEVRGIRYENRSVVALQAEPGQRVELVRDYDNPLDRNAIAVYLSKRMMGYVPYQVAQLLAPEMDTGTRIQATIVSIRGRHPPRVFVRTEMEDESCAQ